MPGQHGQPLALRTGQLPSIGDLSRPDLPMAVPTYDRSVLRPSMIHIGVGGFHRAHLAMYIDRLCSLGETAWSIVGAGILAHDAAMAEALDAQDHLYSLVVRGPDEVSIRIIGAMVDYLHAHPDPTELIERIAAPATQIVSLTITEGGYPVDHDTGDYDPDSPVGGTESAFGILARGLDLRRRREVAPLTVVSCDNIVSNGRISRAATLGEAAKIDPELPAWIDERVTFPNSMVDRITPATTDADRAWLAEEVGIDDRWPVFTEPFTLWVIEDDFAGERPPLERLDVIVTDDVEPFEQMKLRLLNAAHSTMAYLASLLGYTMVPDAMADRAIRAYVQGFLESEARPVLPHLDGYDVDEFQNELIPRFTNPAIADQLARLCLDGTAKFPKFLLPTVRDQLDAGGPIGLSALALAGWCLYLRGGTAEDGSPIDVAPDPNRDEAMARAAASVDDPASFLDYSQVFGDLGSNQRLRTAFAEAVQALESSGVVSSVKSILGD